MRRWLRARTASRPCFQDSQVVSGQALALALAVLGLTVGWESTGGTGPVHRGAQRAAAEEVSPRPPH